MDPVTRYQAALGELAMAAAKLFTPSLFAEVAPDLERWAVMGEVPPPELRLVPALPDDVGDPLVP